MRISRRIAAGMYVSLILAAPAFATSNYAYKPNEYPLIAQGLSPDKHQSIRAHGGGDLGDDNFHVYLYREAPQKRVGALEEVAPLDTAPDALTARWAPDSHAVAIEFRSDRHVLDTIAYSLANNRAYQITGPLLLEAATKVKAQSIADDEQTSETIWRWDSGNRFTLNVSRTYRAKSDALKASFGAYGRQSEDNGSIFVEFSAEAECEIVGNSYRIISLHPGKFK